MQQEIAVLEQAERDQRVVSAAFDRNEQRCGRDAAADKPQDDRRIPIVYIAAPRDDQDEARGGNGHGDDAENVKTSSFLPIARMVRQKPGAQRQGGQTQRDVDPKAPAPTERFGEEAAEQRADDHAYAEARPHDSQVFAALSRREDVGDDSLRQDHQTAAAQALNGATSDKAAHAVGQPANARSCHKEHQRPAKQVFAPEQVAKLAVQGHHDGAREHIGGANPQHVVDASQLARNRR